MDQRKGTGRRKVEMVMMEKESNRSVTFSKRRNGVFKKASELSTLCGVEIALLIFSPANKVFSFGHPSVDAVIDRYLNAHHPTQQFPPEIAEQLEARRNANIRELNHQLTEMTNQLEARRKRGAELDRMTKEWRQQYWCALPHQELSLPQLQQLKSALDELRMKVKKEKEKYGFEDTNPRPFYFGSSSSGQGPTNDLPLSDPIMNMGGQGFAVPDVVAPTPGYYPIMPDDQGYVFPNTIAPTPGYDPIMPDDHGYVFPNTIAPTPGYYPIMPDDHGYVFPNMIAPTPGYYPIMPDDEYVFPNTIAPTSGYMNPNMMGQDPNMMAPPPLPGYNPAMTNEGYNVIPNIVTPPPGYDANPQEYSIPGPPPPPPAGPGFGHGYF